MRKTTRYARTSALPAIAAALALSSTPVFAQETPAQPTTATTTTTTTPTDPVSAAPAPVLDTIAPATTDTTVTTTSTAPAAKATTVKSRHVATAAKPAATHTVAQKTVTRTTHVAVPAAATPTPAAAAPAAPAAPAPSQSAVKPIVDTSAAPPPQAQTATAKPSNGPDKTAMEVGGGALALIAVGAGAWALSRRRRDEDEVVYEDAYEPEADHVAHEPEMAAAAEDASVAEDMPRHDPVEEPNIVAPAASAFAWGKPDPATQAEDDGSDRRPGETWVERAYRGPSPANPSVSLKTRLRRAAFFDKRERDVAAGVAEPVDTDAGLPDAMVDEQEREIA